MIVKTIFYTYDGANDYEDTISGGFDEWLKKHNQDRKKSGNDAEDVDEFTIYEKKFSQSSAQFYEIGGTPSGVLPQEYGGYHKTSRQDTS